MHGWTHDKMTKYSAAENASRLERVRNEINESVRGGYVSHLMRPPYGSTNANVRAGARSAEAAIILWSVDTLDWQSKNRDKIVNVVKKNVKDGSIILFHDRLRASLEAIDVLIPWLQEQGYEIVTVTKLLESSGQPLQYGKVYRSA